MKEDRKDLLTCRVMRGEVSNENAVALEMALDDLRLYWEKAFGAGSFLLDDEQTEHKADMDLLIGTAGNLPAIAALEADGLIEKIQVPEQGFALDILDNDGERTAVLRAADRLGLQYAVYGFAEQFLGVRFVHPLLDFQPETPPMPKELRLKETPSRPMRILNECSNVRCSGWGTLSKRAHFSDMVAWRWEDWAGNPERLKRWVAWAVKNRSNIVSFNDTALICARSEFKPFCVTHAVWEYLDARGLKTIMWCGPGYTWNAKEPYNPEDLCNHKAPRVGPWDKHLCVEKPGFWKEADDWLDLLQPHAHRLAALFTNWQENVCGEGVTEGHEDGVIHRHGESPYDMNSACFRKAVLSKGAGCTGCGHLDNVDKWNKHLDYMRAEAPKHGLPPVGITRTCWGNAEPDDGMVAERVVPHLPPGSLSNVAAVPSMHRAGMIEAWPRLMDAINRADNGNRRMVLYRQLMYTCASDAPLVAFTNLDRVDEDDRVLGKYASYAGAMGDVFVQHSLGWLLQLYSMRKNWQPGTDWREWFRNHFRGLAGDEFSRRFIEIAAALQDVEVLEGLEPGEEPAGYYSRWALNIWRLTPETLPRRGPLNDVYGNCDGPFIRLVKAGARDSEGILTSERCAPALKRVLSMRGKIEKALEGIPLLADSLPGGLNGQQMSELIVAPLRVTARFLQARLLLVHSYLVYIRMREDVLAGRDAGAAPAEGARLCREALDAQDEYTRLRPGFADTYPSEINPATLRRLITAWQGLAKEPGLCRDLDICAFLDRNEAPPAAPTWKSQ